MTEIEPLDDFDKARAIAWKINEYIIALAKACPDNIRIYINPTANPKHGEAFVQALIQGWGEIDDDAPNTWMDSSYCSWSEDTSKLVLVNKALLEDYDTD